MDPSTINAVKLSSNEWLVVFTEQEVLVFHFEGYMYRYPLALDSTWSKKGGEEC
jgi:hypothetical protein